MTFDSRGSIMEGWLRRNSPFSIRSLSSEATFFAPAYEDMDEVLIDLPPYSIFPDLSWA